jgi:YaiO family outer membrane protein
MSFKLTRPLAWPLLLAGLAASGQLAAQSEPTQGTLEAGALHHTLSDGFGNWNHLFVRGNVRLGADDLLNAELVHARQFGDSGNLMVLGDTHTFNADWYGSASMATSTGGFFFPHSRFDLTANRKWLAGRNLVSTLGLTAINAKDGHRDRSLLAGASYYFAGPWIAEGGMRFNRSNPGRVNSNGKYLALTYAENQRRMVSLRRSIGSEAYQYIGENALLVDFHSSSWTGTWRQWLRPKQGFQVRAESYSNPYYHRHGIELSLFQEF